MMKPFNLSANNNKLLAKKRLINSNIDLVNNRIAEQTKRKQDCTKPVPGRYYGGDTSPKRFVSKSPAMVDDEVVSLSNRIERYCNISKIEPNVRLFSHVEVTTETTFNNNIQAILSTEVDKPKMLKKQAEVKNFEDVFEKTRREAKEIEKSQKNVKKNDKMAKHKMDRFNKENSSLHSNNQNDLMLVEK
jgi:hypothetical protein